MPFPTLSTAEAELVEAIEAFTLGDSVDAILAEHEQGSVKSLYIDNQAAVPLLGEGPTSWRTRHLKLRAASLRWRLTRLDWRAVFIPGDQVADLGTKAPEVPLRHERCAGGRAAGAGRGEEHGEADADRAMGFIVDTSVVVLVTYFNMEMHTTHSKERLMETKRALRLTGARKEVRRRSTGSCRRARRQRMRCL